MNDENLDKTNDRKIKDKTDEVFDLFELPDELIDMIMNRMSYLQFTKMSRISKYFVDKYSKKYDIKIISLTDNFYELDKNQPQRHTKNFTVYIENNILYIKNGDKIREKIDFNSVNNSLEVTSKDNYNNFYFFIYIQDFGLYKHFYYYVIFKDFIYHIYISDNFDQVKVNKIAMEDIKKFEITRQGFIIQNDELISNFLHDITYITYEEIKYDYDDLLVSRKGDTGIVLYHKEKDVIFATSSYHSNRIEFNYNFEICVDKKTAKYPEYELLKWYRTWCKLNRRSKEYEFKQMFEKDYFTEKYSKTYEANNYDYCSIGEKKEEKNYYNFDDNSDDDYYDYY